MIFQLRNPRFIYRDLHNYATDRGSLCNFDKGPPKDNFCPFSKTRYVDQEEKHLKLSIKSLLNRFGTRKWSNLPLSYNLCNFSRGQLANVRNYILNPAFLPGLTEIHFNSLGFGQGGDPFFKISHYKYIEQTQS